MAKVDRDVKVESGRITSPIPSLHAHWTFSFCCLEQASEVHVVASGFRSTERQRKLGNDASY